MIGIEAVSLLSRRALDLGLAQFRLDRANDTARDLLLKREDVVERAVETVGPDMCAGCRIDQLAGDANSTTGLAHAAFEHVTHAKLAPDFTSIVRPL